MVSSVGYKSINAKEYIPMHQETFSKVIESELGKYYYTKIIGDKLDAKYLIFEEEGYWYWKGHLYPLDEFIENLKNIHAGKFQAIEKELINKLKEIDKQFGKDVGQQVLELLARVVNYLPSFEGNKKAYQLRIKKAKAQIRKLHNDKDRYLKKLESYDEVPKEEIEKLRKYIEEMIKRSKSKATIKQFFSNYDAGNLIGHAQTMRGKKGIYKETFGKENPVLEDGIISLNNLLDPQATDKTHWQTAKTIDYLLNKAGIHQNAYNLRRIIKKRLSL